MVVMAIHLLPPPTPAAAPPTPSNPRAVPGETLASSMWPAAVSNAPGLPGLTASGSQEAALPGGTSPLEQVLSQAGPAAVASDTPGLRGLAASGSCEAALPGGTGTKQNKQKFKVRQPQRAARSKRPNTPSDGSKNNGIHTTKQEEYPSRHPTTDTANKSPAGDSPLDQVPSEGEAVAAAAAPRANEGGRLGDGRLLGGDADVAGEAAMGGHGAMRGAGVVTTTGAGDTRSRGAGALTAEGATVVRVGARPDAAIVEGGASAMAAGGAEVGTGGGVGAATAGGVAAVAAGGAGAATAAGRGAAIAAGRGAATAGGGPGVAMAGGGAGVAMARGGAGAARGGVGVGVAMAGEVVGATTAGGSGEAPGMAHGVQEQGAPVQRSILQGDVVDAVGFVMKVLQGIQVSKSTAAVAQAADSSRTDSSGTGSRQQ